MWTKIKYTTKTSHSPTLLVFFRFIKNYRMEIPSSAAKCFLYRPKQQKIIPINYIEDLLAELS